jgi:hypothetical protein
MRDNDKPKKPSSPFLRYLQEARDNIPRGKDQSYNEWLKATADKWKAMPDGQKKPYADAALIDFNKYKEDISKWELKMIRLGNSDLVRVKMAVDQEVRAKPKRKSRSVSSDSD